MSGRLARIILYILIVFLPVGLAIGLRQPEGLLIDAGRSFGLMGFMILVLQFLLASRIKWIERAFGLDVLIRFHRVVALGAILLLLLHPILIAMEDRKWELLYSLDLPWPVLLGKAALTLVILNVLAGIYQSRIGLSFEKWRLGHDITAPLILVMVFTHSWLAGEVQEIAFMQVFWGAAFILAIAVFVEHRFLRPRRLRLSPYQVREVRQETEDVWTVEMTPPEKQSVPDYLPGQFHFLTFFRNPELPVEEHHWTISSSPTRKDHISSTIKAVGDFTSTIHQTRPGDTVAVHGPFGRFSCLLYPGERDLVFLAGGIGITPLMSMLRYMRDTKDTRSVLLLYANRGQSRIIFREELEEIASGENPDLTLVHVLSRPEGEWSGETGHIDRQKIEKYCGSNLQGKTFYVCAPLKMADILVSTLRGMGVPGKRIRREIFSFLD